MSTKDFLPDSDVVAKVIAIFERVDPESRERLFHTLGTYLGLNQVNEWEAKPRGSQPRETSAANISRFTEDRSLTAKEFLVQKEPHTDVERVACLAYYLTHYQSKPHFKTIDISRLNTEAAQIKFSNPAFSVANATQSGYLTQAGRGAKQITALGERFVSALPDREAAKAAMSTHRKRRIPKTRKKITDRKK